MRWQLFISMKGLIFLCCLNLVFSKNSDNNVCLHVQDYDNKFNNKNCWYNSDVDLKIPDVIVQHGYPLETYQVITQDEYVLQLYRIPHGKNNTHIQNEVLQPVLLIHGIFASCAPWVINGNDSIGFILADEGYDVWLGNSRGSTYGKGHLKFSLRDHRFWNFSYHEMGVYDTPKTLDMIYKVTKRKDIILVGQSMGTNVQLVYASELPDHAKKRVKFMVYLAPTAFLINLKTPLAQFAPFWPIIEKTARKYGVNEIFSKEQFSTESLSKMCLHSGVQFTTCELLVFSAFGMDFENLAPETFPVLLGHYPAGSSVKSFIHLTQGVSNKRFAQYDYGARLNTKYYNSVIPPSYKLSKVSIPGHIMYGANDWLATEEGSSTLYRSLPKINTIFKIQDERYNHIDFFFAKNVYRELIQKMLESMNKYKTTITTA